MAVTDTQVAELRARYIELLKMTLTHALWYDQEDRVTGPVSWLKRLSTRLIGYPRTTRKDKFEGKNWPEFAHTMIGFPRLDNLQNCVEQALRDGVPGDLIETGVWRGGACIFMKESCRATATANA